MGFKGEWKWFEILIEQANAFHGPRPVTFWSKVLRSVRSIDWGI